MTRLNLVLLLGLILSALYLVNVQYQSRRLYSEFDRAQSQAHRLAAENEALQVEKRAQATSARVAALAKSKLQMRAATPAVTTYVTYAHGAVAPAVTSVGAISSPSAASGGSP
ncbi:MAG: cell division protein FtsL [Comamonadaceae bacterium CG_4_9_14_3_um_filter_60_33]|nr:MAG: cell division protein FtsL [Comamonadaceae bacterium CG2_30_59_20]PIY29549.1 MAG: cell division protein FtsL [Comamonadaceae bacterium CG_4_10_14_3_um_filter_60_42]PJB46364.1 MAG: cell division protein FtsL [Comamonadaceae bacterium CG_4_9_14_3_um_filter_60_33]